MPVRVLITVLCGVGLYVSLFMLAKSKRAERGELKEPSVVQRPAAHLFGNAPNSLVGTIYYPAFAVAVWLAHARWETGVLLLICAAAAGTSAWLAYSLTYITRMSCPYCWTSHIVNWTLLLCYSLAFSGLA